MRTSRNLLIAGVAVAAIACGAGIALAQGPAWRTMSVPLLDGGVVQIQYRGDVAPRVSFAPSPFYDSSFFVDDARPAPFAIFDRIAAEMHRDMRAMLHDIDAASAPAPQQMFSIDARGLPPGAVSYSATSTVADNGAWCTRSMEITRAGPNARPKVVNHMSGDCTPSGNVKFGAERAAPPQRSAPVPDVMSVRDWRPAPAAPPPVREAVYWPRW